jgi:transposase-like protein
MEPPRIRRRADPAPPGAVTRLQIQARPARDLVLDVLRTRRFGILRHEPGVHWRKPRGAQAVSCIHCGAAPCHRWGKFSGRQRFRCTRCGRTFSDLTGTLYARCKRIDRWPAVLAAMERGESVRGTALSSGVAPSTAFRWRHRYLATRGDVVRPPFVDICTLGSEGMSVQAGASSYRGAWFAFARGRLSRSGIVEDRLALIQLVPNGMGVDPHAEAVLAVAGPRCRIADARGRFGRFVTAARRVGMRSYQGRPPESLAVRRRIRGVTPFLRPFRGVSARWARNYLVWGLHLPVGRLEWPVRFGRLVPPAGVRSRWVEHLVVVVSSRGPPGR